MKDSFFDGTKVEDLSVLNGTFSKCALLFYFPGCPSCQMFKPTYVQLAQSVKCYAYNVRLNSPNVNMKYTGNQPIVSVPTIVLFNSSGVSTRYTGSRDLDDLLQTCKTYFST